MKVIIEYACTFPGFCRFFATYEDAWRFVEAYFNNTGHTIYVEPIYSHVES